MSKHTIFITGGAGYIGSMLVDQLSKREDIEKIITLDKDPEKEITKENPNKSKIIFIQKNLSDKSWIEEVKRFSPDIVIHTAWQIREIYGDRKTSWDWNINGSNNVFDFCFENSFVKKLTYFSTVASYGAFPENTFSDIFFETNNFRETQYLYAEEKRIAEENLKLRFEKAKLLNENLPAVSVVRPASITGPKVKKDTSRFGLQSALSGSVRGGVYTLISKLTAIMPATKGWARQYIHEDDVNDIVTLLSLDENVKHEYEVFNICPPGNIVYGKDMAKAVNKKLINLPPQLIRLVFSIFWHMSHGKVPTAPGSWRGYSYPIIVDGSKIAKMYNYIYKFKTDEAFVTRGGRYK